jgi:serine/threonine-protein kinase
VALLRDLASVLEHAHQRGVIHCGLRPSRVVLTARTRESPVCVMDWSDARAHDAGPSSFPITSESWHYTAPELAAGDAVDDRADVFAIGVIAYQLLTGGLPYQHRGLTGGAALAAEHCPSLGALRADLPRELSTLVDQMLSYQRWDRPSSAEVRDGLAWIATALAEAGRAGARIRRPRWTPPLELEPIGDPDRAAAAIGDRADS